MKYSFIITFFLINIIIIVIFFVIFKTIIYGLQMLVNIFVKTSVLKVISCLSLQVLLSILIDWI